MELILDWQPKLSDHSETDGVGYRKLRTLIVDGYNDAADTLALLVKSWGHSVCIARTGPDAIEAVAAFQPDVVLSEIALPRMNGYDLARRLREGNDPRRPVMIAITALGDTQARQLAWDAGFVLYLVKPVDLGELETVLEKFAAVQCSPPEKIPSLEGEEQCMAPIS
jgi:CheY-like chemotaxis protein